MRTFNSLGSNYSGVFTLKSLLPARTSATRSLRSELQKRYDAGSVYMTYKGREAITLILQQLNLATGSSVAINGYTCYVVYAAVEAAGLKSVLVDIEKDDLNFSAESLEATVKKHPEIKAVIIQNSFGIASPIDKIGQVCVKYNLSLIEDLAHSAGLLYESGQEAGTVGAAAALSFSRNKLLDSVCGGAAIFQTHVSRAKQYPSVKLWQQAQAYFYPLNMWLVRCLHHLIVGQLYLVLLKKLKLLPELMTGNPADRKYLPAHSGRLGLIALRDLPGTIAHHQKIADIYRRNLPVEIQVKHTNGAIYIRFPIIINDRQALSDYLRGINLYLGVPWYDVVIAPGPYMSKTDYISGSCPNGEYVAEHVINLPTHINVSESQARGIAGKVTQWLKSQ